jgi:hypothetical protein
MPNESLRDLDYAPVLLLVGWVDEQMVRRQVKKALCLMGVSFSESLFALRNEKSVNVLREDRRVVIQVPKEGLNSILTSRCLKLSCDVDD